MSTAIPGEVLAAASEYVATHLGLHFPPAAWGDLERGLAAAGQELAGPDAVAGIRALLGAPPNAQRLEQLARHLTIGETYFFREQPALAALEQHILPALIEARRAGSRHLRIWSAACCTGEEVYTIAIIVQRLLPDWRDWRLTILGTDVNPQFLQRARAGVYRDWSFRLTPPAIKERYFAPAAGGYVLDPEIKAMVRFAALNLAEASYAAAAPDTCDMDVIFCRNALMYFTPESAARAILSFHRALLPGGWLIVNPSEATPSLFPQYEIVHFADAILYRKPDLPAAQENGRVAAVRPARPRHVWAATGAASRPARSAAPAPPGGAAGPPVASPPAAKDPYAEARRLYEQGSYQEATDLLLRMVAVAPGEARGFALLAQIAADQGELETALRWCAQASGADNLNAQHYYLQATILQEMGNHDQAMAALKRVLYLDPDFAPAYFVLGNLLRLQGQDALARKHFATARALAEAPRAAKAWLL